MGVNDIGVLIGIGALIGIEAGKPDHWGPRTAIPSQPPRRPRPTSEHEPARASTSRPTPHKPPHPRDTAPRDTVSPPGYRLTPADTASNCENEGATPGPDGIWRPRPQRRAETVSPGAGGIPGGRLSPGTPGWAGCRPLFRPSWRTRGGKAGQQKKGGPQPPPHHRDPRPPSPQGPHHRDPQRLHHRDPQGPHHRDPQGPPGRGGAPKARKRVVGPVLVLNTPPSRPAAPLSDTTPLRTRGTTQNRAHHHHVYARRCPTLPPPGRDSTIGAGGLSFRVRKGSRAWHPRYDHRDVYQIQPPTTPPTNKEGKQ